MSEVIDPTKSNRGKKMHDLPRSWVYIKKYFLKFESSQSNLFYFFGFAIYKIVDVMNIYKSLIINIGTVMRNLEMIKFVHDHIKGRSSGPELFCRKGVLGNFTKFTGKSLCQGFFLNKVAGFRPATY